MAGHSKWSKVQHITGPLKVKRGAAYGKPVKEITVPARIGGGDWSGDPRLRPLAETVLSQHIPKKSCVSPGRAAAAEHRNCTTDQRFIFSKLQKGVSTMPCARSDRDSIPEAIPSRLAA